MNVGVMMPFIKDPTATKKVSIVSIDTVSNQQQSISLELPVSDIKVTSSKLPDIKIVEIIFSIKTLTIDTGPKTLNLPKANNCMHPQLFVSSIPRPYYLLLLPPILYILFFYFFTSTLP